MIHSSRHVWALAALCCWCSTAPGQGLAPEEIARKGKAATALVELRPPGTYATVFCVHPSGLFVASARAAAGAESEPVTLVRDPGLKTQKLLKAKVVRSEPDLGLTVLQVEGEKDLSALALGTAEKLGERAELFAFGFPSRSDNPTELPALSVRRVRVAALKHEAGELGRLRLDAALDAGSLGGPLLDAGARVVGVIAAAEPGKEVEAVPTDRLTRFLLAPSIQFMPPAIDPAAPHRPVEFQARAVPLLPADRPLEVRLMLRAEGQERTFEMKPADGVYRVTAPALPAPEGPPPLSAAVLYANGTEIRGAVADRPIKIGAKEVPLRAVRQLLLGPKPRAVLADGTVLEGAPAGLDALEVRAGGAALPASLSGVRVAVFQPAALPDVVTATVVALHEGKEVGRLRGGISIRGAARPGDPDRPAIWPPFLPRDRVVVPLSSPCSDVVPAGGGRYLVLPMPKERKAAVFDVSEARLVGAIPLAEAGALVAGGLDEVIVVLPAAGLLQRWSLPALERKTSVAVPFTGAPLAACMGAGSRGPLLAVHLVKVGTPPDRVAVILIDLETMKTEVPADARPLNLSPVALRARASHAGTEFTVWRAVPPLISFWTVVRGGREARAHERRPGSHLVPAPDGRRLPTMHDNYYLVVHGVIEPGVGSSLKKPDPFRGVSLFAVGGPQSLLNLPQFDLGPAKDRRTPLDLHTRIVAIPQGKLIITLPEGRDRLVLHRLDLEEEIAKSGNDYLFVASGPPTTVRPGEVLVYPVQARSKQGGTRFHLLTAPAGMTVSPLGTVVWAVPADWSAEETEVLVEVRDAGGKKCQHGFRLRLVK